MGPDQDQSFPFALMLAAHGERRANANNAEVARLARKLAGAGVAAEVGYCFIKGTPSVDEGIQALHSCRIVVYPLFLSDGYFTRVALPQALEHATHRDAERRIVTLPPLGLEPALADLIVEEVGVAVRSRAISPKQTTVVMLAHGSTNDPASRIAAERLAEGVRQSLRFRNTRVALLEEPPCLAEAIADARGPTIVVGLFAGEGMHGVDDAKHLVAQLRRDDVVLVGPVGTFAGIETIVTAAVAKHILNQ